MGRILMVDDEKDLELLIKQRFRRQIQNGNFEFFFAHDGFEALKILDEESPIDIVVTDIHMPGMDGLTLLDKIPEYSPGTRSIVLSAYGDVKNLRKAMNHGAFDFITKPLNFSELEKIFDHTLKVKNFNRSEISPHSNKGEAPFFDVEFSDHKGNCEWQVNQALLPALEGSIIFSWVTNQRISAFSQADWDDLCTALKVIMFILSKPEVWLKKLIDYHTINQKKTLDSSFIGGLFWISAQEKTLKTFSFPQKAFFFTDHQGRTIAENAWSGQLMHGYFQPVSSAKNIHLWTVHPTTLKEEEGP